MLQFARSVANGIVQPRGEMSESMDQVVHLYHLVHGFEVVHWYHFELMRNIWLIARETFFTFACLGLMKVKI